MKINIKTTDISKATTMDEAKQILDSLVYGSYRANRDYGMTHEQLLSIGIGNDSMKAMYELEQQNNSN